MKLKVVLAMVLIFVINIYAQTNTAGYLNTKYELGGERSPEIQYFVMESEMMAYALNGDRLGTDKFRLYLKCVPAEISGKGGDEYTCLKFTIQPAGTAEAEIPVLKDWSYIYKKNASGIDEKEQVFGIDHARFENLKDITGRQVPADKAYHVYNAFIDFHSINDVFSVPMEGGAGIQDIHTIGQKIVHSAAYSEPPVNLGSQVEKGSVFKNGKVTLEFKGLSIVNDKPCALLEYDSGESSFKMKMKPMPEMEINTKGASHYKGDIYKALTTNWVQKANLSELVVTETQLPFAPHKVNLVIERSINIKNVKESEIAGRN